MGYSTILLVIFMRLRNVKGKEAIINNSKYIINSTQIKKGSWNEIFGNNNDIYIEIGMGKGKFIIENAIKYPNINFIGIEKYDSVIVRAVEKLEEKEIPNLRLLILDANKISDIFNKEISRIYLNFSDPWPKKRHSKRRLTSEIFLKEYDKIFKSIPEIHMKTDNKDLFEFSLVSVSQYGYTLEEVSFDYHNSGVEDIIMTEYEKRFSSREQNIYRLVAVKKVSSR